MAEISIKQLASVVKTTPEKLVEQLRDAGVSVASVDHSITDAEKKQLLLYLRKNKATKEESKPAPVKLSLSKAKKPAPRQRVSTNVDVQVRKKRKLIKPKAIEEVVEEIVEDNIDVAVESPADIKSEVINEEAQGVPVDVVADPVEDSANKEQLEDDFSLVIPKVVKLEKPSSKKETEQSKKSKDTTEATQPALPPRETASDSSKKQRKSGKKKRSHSRFDDNEDDRLHFKSKGAGDRRRKKAGRATISTKASADNEHGFALPTAPIVHDVMIPESITVADLALKLKIKAAEIIKVMMGMGAMVTINQMLDQDTAVLVVEEMGHNPITTSENAIEEHFMEEVEDENLVREPRPPVVTIMGHVDHGKTSLLDYIRRTKVTSTEAGGITQHIGAYHVETPKGVVTFLDTPGHEAFTAMRARGADCTDIVVLVVAADDGVMPQTIEAIKHAKAAKVPIVVAVNKIDKEGCDFDRIRNELSQHEIIAEDWGGDVIFQHLSAKTGEGIDGLLESILLQAEVLELTAVATGPAKGIVLESKLDKGRGPVASILVLSGQLNKGDIVLAGKEFGRVRAMVSDTGAPTEHVGPAMPVEILGLSGTPSAGDDMIVAPNERKAREIAQFRQGRFRAVRLAQTKMANLENIFDSVGSEKQNVLNVVLKADTQGSAQAISDSLIKLSTPEVKVNIVAAAVGGITESDVNLALASKAIILGFNVRADGPARELVGREDIDLRYYSVIYDLIDQVKSALSGLLAPTYKETIVGIAEVKDVFRSSQFGSVAGCIIQEGHVKRQLPIRVLRNNVVIFEGELESLRRYKDDVNDVRSGTECGIGVKNYSDIKAGDQIECYEKSLVARTL